ncbi:LppP/LprE family lipoprotein [Kocuria varians]|uniref:LppP/LprE family lipoprotein n=1 Tax=Kocuria varians TaxID=1272 RepID=UPI0008383A6A|nr:LppP/LprE family lipoprotein [Kocuria varians]
MGRLTRLSTRTTAAAAGALLLAGGIAGPAMAAGQAPAAQAASSSAATSDDCGPENGQQAAKRWIPVLTPPFGADKADQGSWDTENVDTSTYDECQELSSITVHTKGGTASSPNTVMLFHRGAYMGTATNGSFGFTPKVERVTDSTVRVTFRFPKDGDSNAEPTGTAVSTYSWNDDAGQLAHEGQLPPQLIK